MDISVILSINKVSLLYVSTDWSLKSYHQFQNRILASEIKMF